MELFQHDGRPLPAFPADDGQYNDLISAWLAHFASLAYEGRGEVAATLKDLGFDRALLFDDSGTQAFLAKRNAGDGQDGLCIVSFRGTEKDYKDILSDITVFKRTIDYKEQFRVHGGFYTALRHVWGSFWKPGELNRDGFHAEWIGPEGIVERLMELREDGDRVYFTGHSLGGAIAHLAAYEYVKIPGNGLTAVYTIGAPRSADAPFAQHVDEQARYPVYRVVNGADIVPRVPPLLLNYRHFGQLVFLTRRGERRFEATLMLRLFIVLAGIAPLFYRLLPFSWLKWLSGTPLVKIRAFTDHASAEYRRKLGDLVR